MKKATKILALLLCAVLLVAGSVAGTLAYLTSQDEVTNTFTVGNVKITLDEKDVDESETDNEDCEAGRDRKNEYHLLPGKEYIKDPTIHIDEDSEECYVFVKVENDLANIEAATTIADQMTAKGWTVVDSENKIYAHEDVHSGKDENLDVVVFEKFTIKDEIDNDTLAEYADATIKVTAYAIQKEGFGSANEAWTNAGTALLTQG